MFFLDANIFLEVELGDKRSNECKELFSKIYKNQLSAITSDFIIYTCLLQIEAKAFSIEKMRNFIVFMDNMNIEIHAPAYETLYYTFEIMKKHKLDFDDALVVAIMKFLGVKELISFDKDFDYIDEIKRLEPKDVL